MDGIASLTASNWTPYIMWSGWSLKGVWSFESSYNIVLKFGRWICSNVAEMPVKFMSDQMILNINLRSCETSWDFATRLFSDAVKWFPGGFYSITISASHDVIIFLQKCSQRIPHSPAVSVSYQLFFNTLRPRRNEQHFADDIFKRIFFNENVWISIKISLNFVPKGLINNIPAMVQIMVWCRSGAKPLSEPMMVCLPTHICVTRPPWV